MDRLQRAVAGWVGPVVYALPILEVWLLARMGDRGTDALLVVLQAGWALCLLVVLVICGRRWRAPAPGGPVLAVPEGPPVRAHAGRAAGPARETARLGPSSGARRGAPRPAPRRRGDH